MSALASLTTRIESRQARIGVIGLGYVGIAVAAGLSNAGFQVTGVEVKADRVAQLNAGKCRVRIKGQSDWKVYGAGQSFDVPGNSSFDIRVQEAHGAYHYICHFG